LLSKNGKTVLIHFLPHYLPENDWEDIQGRIKDDLNKDVIHRNHAVRTAFMSSNFNMYKDFYGREYISKDAEYAIAVTNQRVVIKKWELHDVDGGHEEMHLKLTRCDYKYQSFPDDVYDYFKHEIVDSKKYQSLEEKISFSEILFTPFKINTEKLTEMFGAFVQSQHERLGENSVVCALDDLILNQLYIQFRSTLKVQSLGIKIPLEDVLKSLENAVASALFEDKDIASRIVAAPTKCPSSGLKTLKCDANPKQSKTTLKTLVFM
jgi:hypothetical protein